MIWPQIESDFDAHGILDFARWICFAYGVIGWLAYWRQDRLLAGFVVLVFFFAAGMALQKRSFVAGVAANSFLVISALACIVAYPSIFEPICLVGACVPLLGSFKAARWDGYENEPRTREISLRSLGIIVLAISATVAVVNGTIFGLFATQVGDSAMQPSIVPGEWLVGVPASLSGPIRHGELWEVNWGTIGSVRVIGMPGDRVEIRNGNVRLNGREIAEPYIDRYSDRMGDFPLASSAYPKGYLR